MDENSTSAPTSENDKGVFVIQGHDVNWKEIDETVLAKDGYEASFRWEYRTSTNRSWQEIPEKMAKQGKDLLIWKSFFSDASKSYDFRQVLTVGKFNRTVYASGDHNYVTVRVYKKPELKNFEVKVLPKYCAGDEINDTVLVKFNSLGGNYCSYMGEDDPVKNNFKWTYSCVAIAGLNGSREGTSLSVPFSAVAKESAEVVVTVTDGCGNEVPLVSPRNITIPVSAKPVLQSSYLDVEGGSKLASSTANNLMISAPQGKNVVIKLNEEDADKVNSNYYISFRKNVIGADNKYEWDARKPINRLQGYTIPSTIAQQNWYLNGDNYYIKIEKESKVDGCESDPLYITINYVGVIGNNRISFVNASTKTAMYVCQGTGNTAISGDQVIGGYGENSEYTYLWQYSNDNEVWVNMTKDSKDPITDMSLAAGTWDRPIDKKYYIRRVATSRMAGADASSAVRSESNVLEISPYSTPSFLLNVNGHYETKKEVCYGEELELSLNLRNDIIVGSQGYKSVSEEKYAYVDKNGKIKMLEGNRITITSDTTLYAAMLMCKDTILSLTSLKVTAGENLTKGLQVATGACKVRGGKMNVNITPKVGYDYEIVAGSERTTGEKAEVAIPDYDFASYQFDVEVSKDKCKGVKTITLERDEFVNGLSKHELYLADEQGGKGVYSVCAGKAINVSARNEQQTASSEPCTKSYTWTVGGSDLDKDLYNANSLKYNLGVLGKNYLITRTISLMMGSKNEVCDAVTDSVSVNTYAKASAATVTLKSLDNKPIVTACYDSEVVLTATAPTTGGSGSYSYEWHRETSKGDDVLKGNGTAKEYTTATGTAAYYAVVKDNTCTDSRYDSKTSEEVLTVEKDLRFTLVATPSVVMESEVETSTRKVGVTSSALASTDKIDASLNGENFIMYEPYLTGVSLSLNKNDFRENGGLAIVEVKRYGQTVTGCSATAQAEIMLNQGFSGPLVIQEEGSVLDTVSTICPGEKVTLKVAQLPLYNNQAVPSDKVSYQWYYHLAGSSLVQAGKGASLAVTAEEGKEVEYLCKMSYTPAGGSAQSVYSKGHTVIGRKGTRIRSISFRANENSKPTKTHYICKGETGTISLFTEDDLDGATMQWYERSVGSEEWQAVRTGGDAANTTEAECLIDLANYSENTQFQLRATNTCGITSASENTLLLVINGGSKFSEKDIIITNTTIVSQETPSMKGVVVNVPRDYKSTYYWSADPKLRNWSTGNPAFIIPTGGFAPGENTIYAYQVSNGQGNCASDTIEYKFNVYKELSAGTLGINAKGDSVCKNDDESVLLSVTSIKGGDGEYKIDWYYRTDTTGNFVAFDKSSQYLPFEILEPQKDNILADGSGQSIMTLTKLQKSCSFRAIISCKGDYPGSYAETNTETRYVYSDMIPGTVDVSSTTLCYDEVLNEITGESPKGGSGNYTYVWLKAEKDSLGTKGDWVVQSKQTGASYKGSEGESDDHLKKTCFFARVTSDGCKSDTSYLKPVQVNEEVTIEPDDIIYTHLIASGEQGSMYGVKTNVDYVWKDASLRILDTTKAQEPYYTVNLKEPVTRYYAQIIKGGCLSSNYDTITINAFEVSGGHLTFNDLDMEAEGKKNWICSGGKVGVISADGASNLKYKWYYKVNDSAKDELIFPKSNGEAVSTASIDLDTCNIQSAFTNNTGAVLEKKISLFRTTFFNVIQDGDTVERHVDSDTLTLYIVPTLNKVSNLLLAGENMAGELKCEKLTYCPGDRGELIDGRPSENLYKVWANGKFGPYLYDPQAEEFTTWFETKRGNEWVKEKIHHGIGDFAEVYQIEEMDTTYQIQRVFSDGCSTDYSNSLKLNLSNRAANAEKLRYKGMTPEGKTVTDCFEMGDELTISYAELGYECYWFADEACTDTLASNDQLLNLGKLDEETPVVVYLKRKDNSNCMSTALSIPLTIYTKSDGGIIYKDQMVCSGEQFTRVVSGRKASGYSYYPSNGVKRQFSYQWQICTNLKTGVWTDIEGATDGEELTEEQLNAAILGTLKHYYVRRKAVNECGRECYSNTITLTYFDAFEGGSLSMSGKKQAFCYTDTFPTIVTSSPTGGYYGEMGYDGYSYAWELSLDGKDYTVVSPLGQQTSRQLDLDYLLRYSEQMEVDFGKKNTLYVRAQYADQCGEAYSEPLSITLWAKTEAPRIYQDKDSCNADAVTIKTYDTDKYQYTWIIIDDEGQITWSYTQDSLKVQRVTDLNVTEYGVLGMEKESGCVSDYTYFNVDSLPVLSQEALFNPYPTICYGSHFTLKGSTVSGGSGEKSYQWQISYDGEKFDDYSKEEDFEMEKMTSSMYVRRVIIDQCDNDTTNTLYLPVTKKLTAPEDLVRLDDYRCEEQLFMAYLNTELFDSLKTAYGSSFSDLRVDMTAEDGVKEAVFDSERTSTSMFGFEGARKGYSLYLVGKSDSSSMECKSAPLGITAHNISPIDDGYNVIGCQTLEPCNETIVEIVGGDATDDEESWRHISWKWYKSTDKEQWTELLLKTGQNLNLEIADTMYVKRVANNGCEIKESNILTFVGRKLTEVDYERELEMQVVTTQQDSGSVVVLTVNSAELEAFGNGEMPLLKVGKNTLPYTAEQYEDSILKLRKSGTECYSTYKVQPLRGGRISMDGDGVVCPKEAISPIVATELEGGNGEYEYQWQYRNDNVPEWVNLPGETGKSYQPMATTVRTWYRRVSKSGIYTSYSNEVSVTIAPAVKVGYIRTDKDSAYYAQYGLKLTDFSVQRTATMDMQLQAEVVNATLAWWETYNATWKWWEKVTSVVDLTDSVQRMDVTDTTEQVRYRLVAINACGADTSEEFTVYTQNIPLILDEELTLEPAKCYGQDAKVYVRRPGTDYRNYRTMYSGYSGEMYILKLVNGEDVKVSVTEKDSIEAYTVYFKNVTEPFTIKATRLNIVTGASSSREIEVPFKKFEADFTYTVDGVEHDLSETDVEMQQGSLVEFHNKIENVCYYYDHNYWELIEAPNPDLAPEGARKYGLESHQVSPSCYFYNAGRYQVTYIATSWSGCKDTIVFDALHIPANAVHSMKLPIAAEFVEAGQPASVSVAEVYPSMFSDELTIRYPKKRFSYSVYASDGKSVLSGSGEDESRLQTSVLQSGVYLVEVDGWLFKVVKK